MPLAPDHRAKQLGLIHIGAKALGMDTLDDHPESEYRAMLWTLGRVRSAAHLDFAGRKAVIEHLKALGAFRGQHRRAKPASGWEWVNNAAGERQPLLRKIAVMLRDTDREKAYADGIAKRMFGILVVEFCAPDQLRKIVSSLVYDSKRKRDSGTTNHEPRSTNHGS